MRDEGVPVEGSVEVFRERDPLHRRRGCIVLGWLGLVSLGVLLYSLGVDRTLLPLMMVLGLITVPLSIVVLVRALTGRRWIEVDDDGFTERYLFRSVRTRWEAVHELRPALYGMEVIRDVGHPILISRDFERYQDLWARVENRGVSTLPGRGLTLDMAAALPSGTPIVCSPPDDLPLYRDKRVQYALGYVALLAFSLAFAQMDDARFDRATLVVIAALFIVALTPVWFREFQAVAATHALDASGLTSRRKRRSRHVPWFRIETVLDKGWGWQVMAPGPPILIHRSHNDSERLIEAISEILSARAQGATLPQTEEASDAALSPARLTGTEDGRALSRVSTSNSKTE